MKLKEFTTDEKIVNLILAAWRWSELDPEVVDLDSWHGRNSCGTTGCFGGWLATWPEFQEMGVRGVRRYGENCRITRKPAEPCDPAHPGFPYHVSKVLFGESDLFQMAFTAPPDYNMHDQTSDYDLVVNRIEAQYADLVESLGEQP